MELYRIKVAIPSIKNGWEANVEERYIEAENFNDMLMKSMSIEETARGARIIKIEREDPEKYCYWHMIKYC
jgi:hypothetical protein